MVGPGTGTAVQVGTTAGGNVAEGRPATMVGAMVGRLVGFGGGVLVGAVPDSLTGLPQALKNKNKPNRRTVFDLQG